MSPLLKACQKDHVDAVRELLAANPSLGLCENGDSPLYTAVLRRNLPIIRLLLKAGADPHLNATSGTPYSLAVQLQDWRSVQLMNNTRNEFSCSIDDNSTISSSSSPESM